jgi:SRF-type transcription factor (DNA-binding and dimerisation domain)
MRKRQRTLDMHPGTVAPAEPQAHPAQPAAPVADDAFITDHDAAESGGDDDEEEEKPKNEKKAGRRKIKIEFIQDKSRRHITFSKRKAGQCYSFQAFSFITLCSIAKHALPSGIMKKVYIHVIFVINVPLMVIYKTGLRVVDTYRYPSSFAGRV